MSESDNVKSDNIKKKIIPKKNEVSKKMERKIFEKSKISDLNQCQCQTMTV